MKRRRAPRSYRWPRRRVPVALRVTVNGMYIVGEGFVALPAELRSGDTYIVAAETPYSSEFFGPGAFVRIELRVRPGEAV
ncbi:MAG: hypothetical protein ACJ768_09330 [Gaiellaceae bacterium]